MIKKENKMALYIRAYGGHTAPCIVWHSGRTLVFDWRTFPALRSTYSWWV